MIPGVLVFRPEASLLYFNMDHVRDTIVERVGAEATLPKFVVLDLSAAAYVDMHAAHMLAELADELDAAGMRVQVVEAAVVRARPFTRRRGGVETRRDQSVQLGGRCGGQFSEKRMKDSELE